MNIWDTSATPSGIKREWYVCVYVYESPNAREREKPID
jgi:hypothetical protein